MGATRFDGPAGQIHDDDADASSRRPSQPNGQTTRKLTTEHPRSRGTSGLNQRSRSDILGREPASIDGKRLSSSLVSKTSTQTRKPRFHLRTVPPAVDVNKFMRPVPLSVPASRRSEVPSKREQTSQTSSPPPEEKSDTTGEDPLAAPTFAGFGDESPHKAIDALTTVVEHDDIVTDRLKLVLHKTPSQEKLGSTSSVKQSEILLTESRIGETISGPAAASMSISRDNNSRSHDDPSEAPAFPLEDDHGERDVVKQIEVNERDDPDISHKKEENGDPLDGPSISSLLVQLPPIRKSTIEHVGADPLLVEPFAASGNASTATSTPSASSLESVPLNADERLFSQDFPLLARSPEAEFSVKGGQAAKVGLGLESTSATELERPSQKSPGLSAASRAMSMLSEISARTGLQAPSLSSITRRRKKGSTAISNLTTKPHHRLKRSSQDSGMSPVGKGYSVLGDDVQIDISEGADSKNRSLGPHNQHTNGAGFSKIIQDLETLLSQALALAGQATDENDGENMPLTSQETRYAYGQAHSTESVNSSRALSSLSGARDEEDNFSTVPPQQPTVEEPQRDALYHDKFKKAREPTSYPVQTMSASTVPYVSKQQAGNRLLNVESVSQAADQTKNPMREQSSAASDWAVIRAPSHASKLHLERKPPPHAPQPPPNAQPTIKEQHALLLRAHGASESTLSKEVVRDYVNTHHQPPIQPRLSSRRLKIGRTPRPEELNLPESNDSDAESDCDHVPYVADFKTAGLHYHPVVQEAMAGDGYHAERHRGRGFQPRYDTAASLRDADDKKARPHRRERSANKDYTLNDRHHVSVRESHGFSLSRSHRRSPIARDWSTSRKRFVATVTCITTAFMGMVIGIYAGEVPAIQYTIADEHHYTILGNVLFFLGLAITTALFYPLPLLHGRKPYTLAALAILLPLQFPQALAINTQRSPNVATYRIGLLLPRIIAGIVMGFANMNFFTTLMDLFGASLQSGNPHQEIVNVNDVRRHGGGMGVWLGIWTWCAIGSIGTGFLIGAGIISGLDVSWGFWITIIINAAVLVLNILSPEVRRSAYRRSMAEVRSGGEVSRRVARGEIKMHLESTGPIWWWEEVFAGHVLALRMLLQPGFAILSLYVGWIYGQVVLVIVVSLLHQCMGQHY